MGDWIVIIPHPLRIIKVFSKRHFFDCCYFRAHGYALLRGMENEAGTKKLLYLIDAKNRSRINLNLQKAKKQYGSWGWHDVKALMCQQNETIFSVCLIYELKNITLKMFSWLTVLKKTQHKTKLDLPWEKHVVFFFFLKLFSVYVNASIILIIFMSMIH